MTHYEVLGTDRSASTAEIRRAYLELARRHHPDAVGGSDRDMQAHEDAMRAVNEAWRVLGDADRRARYDDQLAPAPPRPFQAFDDSGEDDDPREQFPDLPYRTRPAGQVARFRLGSFVPLGVAGVGLAAWLMGLALSSRGLVSAGLLALFVAAFGVAATALVALGDARRDEG